MDKRWIRSLLLVLALLLACGSASLAFDDVDADEAGVAIMTLKDKGIVRGDGQTFGGERTLTWAEGIAMIVRGMGLTAEGEAGTAPPVTDRLPNVAADGWHAEAFRAALDNGLDVPRDVEPGRAMNREQFLYMLNRALAQTGDYPFTMKLFLLADETDVNPAYGDAIQVMLNGGFAKLDEEGRLHPKQAITRREAAVTLHAVLDFKAFHDEMEGRDETGEESGHAASLPEGVHMDERAGGLDAGDDVTMTVDDVNGEVVKVTLSRGEKPNSGYGIAITSVVFRDGTAEIQYRLSDPEPDRMYLQVITTPVAVTYVSAGYDVVLKRVE